MINPYIDRHGTDSEKALYNDLAEEYIKYAGWDVVYVQRDNFSEDRLLGRADGDYRNSRVIEMVIEGEGNIDLYNMSVYEKFGLVDSPTATFSMMKRRFEAEFGPDVLPDAGDILFLQHKTNNPLFDEIFEVRKVQMINPVQFGAHVQMYEIHAAHWNMKGETIDTGRLSVDAHDADFDDTHSGLAAENDLIKELIDGISTVKKEDGSFKTSTSVSNDPNQIDPFSHTF